MNIPQNPKRRDFDAEVETAVSYIINGHIGCLIGPFSAPHHCDPCVVPIDVAEKVASLFKDKGYYPLFDRDKTCLQIYDEPR